VNERIKELAKHAGLKIEYQMINPPKPLQILGSAEQFEKFAELIVRECASKAWFAEQYGIGDGAPVSKQIKEHFGVEE
jgi:hypothetical protein